MPAYHKAFYRAALCLEKMGEYGEAIKNISRIDLQHQDQDVKALQSRLMREVTKAYEITNIMTKLKGLLSLDKSKDVHVKDPSTGIEIVQKSMDGHKDIEQTIGRMAQTLEGLYLILSQLCYLIMRS